MRILLLAAGYGTRLYPLTRYVPKALLSVGGKPFINTIIDKLKPLIERFSADEIIIVSNNKFYKKFVSWKKEYKAKVKIINDGSNSPRNRLGAIGDICFSLNGRKKDDWLILGSDNFFDWDLVDFVNFSLKKSPYSCVGIYKLSKLSLAKHFGVVKTDREKRIKYFAEKPKNPESGKVATCIYFFPKESLSYLNDFLKETDKPDASGKYIEWLIGQSRVYGYSFKGRWIDIGHKSNLIEVERIMSDVI